jgi:HEAT repeat protein
MSDDIASLVTSLTALEPDERSDAAERLARLGPDAREGALPLLRALTDESEEVREWAVAALETMGPPPPSTVRALAAMVADVCPDIGYWAATLLGRLADQATPAIPVLARTVCGGVDLAVRQRAAWALGQIGPAAAEALPALQQAAAGDDPRLARLAQQAIDLIRG